MHRRTLLAAGLGSLVPLAGRLAPRVGAAPKLGAAKTKTVRRRFSNKNTVALENDGAGNPYPSVINVKGFKKAKIKEVLVTINAFDHDFPAVARVVMQAPNGESVVLMRNCGGALQVFGAVITLSDKADEDLPEGQQLQGGTFRPTDFDPVDVMPAPSPQTTNTKLSVFNGNNPNGQWKLFAANVADNEDGQIEDGWTLEIVATEKKKKKKKNKDKKDKD